MENDKLQEECGVIGVWGDSGMDSAALLFTGMYGIQHRGEQSAGIAISDKGRIVYQKEMGLASDVFGHNMLQHLKGGKAGIGHVGYNREIDNITENIQPLVIRYKKGQMAISYNGCLLNSAEIRREFEEEGYIIQSTSDAELIALLLSKERLKYHTLEEALVPVMKKLKGSYSFLIMTPNKLIAVRDPHGMKPLCMGKLNDAVIFASETAALDVINAKYERDVIPGEIIVVLDNDIKTIYTKTTETTAMCIFEFVYLARTDSFIDGVNVYDARFEAGRMLAKEHPANADMVMGAPDSAIPAALGYAAESGIPYGEGLTKNRYVGRTFIQPGQSLREQAVRLKLNVLRSRVEGKRIVLVDDSIVRGTTIKQMVQILKEVGGAKEVHMRISSPPVMYSCLYGIDTPSKSELIANQIPESEICDALGIDSIGYLSRESLLKTPVGAKCNFCSTCFDGIYPLGEMEE